MRRSKLMLLSAVSTAAVLALSTAVVLAEEDEEMEEGGIAIAATSATITVDGDASDWEGIERTTVELEQIDLDEIPAEQAEEIHFGAVDPIDVQLAVANDADNIYILVEVPTAYDYVAGEAHLSPAIAVESPIEAEAAEHMGVHEDDLESSVGMVDIWHWELDCGPGETSGGQGAAGGNDDACNFDDEFALTPEWREDDGDGDDPNEAAENSLVGSWSHSAAEVGGDGVWTFEMARPLGTGDPEDAQFEAGGEARLVLAWWDPRESSEGWSDAGHLTNAESGWIEVALD